VCNDEHVLTLKRTETSSQKGGQRRSDYRGGEIVDVPLREYLDWSKTQKHLYKLFRVGVEYRRRGDTCPVDPYLLGLLLGDGTLRGSPKVTTSDLEVVEQIERHAQRYGLLVSKTDSGGTRTPTYSLVHPSRRENPLTKQLRQIGVWLSTAREKFVPIEYQCATRIERLELLAGLIDSDGSYDGKKFEFSSTSAILSSQVQHIARSLGFLASRSIKFEPAPHWRVFISGELSHVPCRIKRKQAAARRAKKDHFRSGFTVEPMGDQDYYGFALDGDGRFLLGDFTVTHNTYIAGAIAKGLARNSTRPIVALYLIHRTELADQAFKTLKGFGLEEMIGRIQPAYPEVRYRPFQIASIPTLVRRLERVKEWLDPLILIVDECHHCRAETWTKVMDAFPEAYRLGMTATPARLDGKGLGTHFDAIVSGPGIGELTDAGWLAPMWMFGVDPKINLKELRRSGAEYNMTAADSLVTETVIADAIENWARRCEGMQTLHYGVTVRHSLEFTEKMNALGYPTEHIDGTTAADVRKAVLERYDRGTTMCVSNVDILTEGYDAPETRCVLLARPTLSMVFYRQAAGRAMRPKEDGGYGYLVDVAGNLKRHGPLDDYIEWTLGDGVQAERRASERPLYRLCASCNLYFPATRRDCPHCGHQPETKSVEEVDVDLIDWGTTGGRKKDTPKAKQRTLNERVIATGGDPDKLQALCAEYGFGKDRLQQWHTLFRPLWEAQKIANG